MMLAFFCLLAQSPTIEYRDPPAHEYVLRATVPHVEPPVHVPGCPTDSRLVLRLADGTPVTEVVALVPGGTSSVTVEPGASPGPPDLTAPTVAWLARPWRVVLDVDGRRFSLSDPAHFRRWHRDGNVLATAELRRDLGPYGEAVWWLTARPSGQVDLTLLWHRASPGAGVRFGEAQLRVRGAGWGEAVADPAVSPPYLVAPLSDGGWHYLPQQCARVFYLRIGGDEPDHVGTADWSQGGYLPAGLAVPRWPADLGPSLALERARLGSLAQTPDWAEPPVEPLWPASGARWGGEGGGWDREPLRGSEWAASGDPAGLELFRIELLRGLSRRRVRFDPNSLPLAVPAERGWSFADSRFLNDRDDPWNWSDYWDPWGGDRDPRLFADHDDASTVRGLNEAWALTWLANEPEARLLTIEGATRALLTHAPLAVPAVPGQGSPHGAQVACSALAVAAARCLGWDDGGWAAAFIAHYRAAQMPSGCLVARLGQYPSGLPPFNTQSWLLQGGKEFAYLQLALSALGASDVVSRSVDCLTNDLAMDDDDSGHYYYAPTGIGSFRFLHENEWPWWLWLSMGVNGTAGYYTEWDTGYSLALAWRSGHPGRAELLRRFTGTTDPLAGAALMRSWGLESPHDRAPFGQWGSLVGEVER